MHILPFFFNKKFYRIIDKTKPNVKLSTILEGAQWSPLHNLLQRKDHRALLFTITFKIELRNFRQALSHTTLLAFSVIYSESMRILKFFFILIMTTKFKQKSWSMKNRIITLAQLIRSNR